MEAIKRVLDKVLSIFCIFLMGAITILVTYQVVVRYFFNSPNPYTEVLAKYGFVWMILYASALVFGMREHMNIGFVREHMPRKMRLIVEMFSELMIALFALGVMLIGGYGQTTKQMIQLDSALQIPIGIVYSAVPISALFILFYFVYNEYKLLKEFKAQPAERS